MDNQGYVKLPREMMSSSIFEDADLWRLYTWCMMKASYKERDIVVNKQVVHIQPGQFIYGRKKAATLLDIAESTLYDWMKILEKLNLIRIEPKNKFSIITVVGDVFAKDTDNRPTTVQQQYNTNKKEKKVKKDKKNESDESLDLIYEFKRMSGGME